MVRLIFTISVCLTLMIASLLPAGAQDSGDGSQSLCVVAPDEIIETFGRSPDSSIGSLAGKLGGPLESFLQIYGVDGQFMQPGCAASSKISSQASVDGTTEIVTAIELVAETNWTVEEALSMVSEVVPPDITMEDAVENEDLNNIVISASSKALADASALGNYAITGNESPAGRVKIVVSLAPDDTIPNVVVQMEGVVIQSSQDSAEAAQLPSRGLGLTGQQWIALYGEPLDTDFDDVVTSFAGGGVRVDHSFFEEDGQAIHFQLMFETPGDVQTAEAMVQRYIPTDSLQISEYSAPVSNSRVVLYHSDWLANEIKPDPELDTLGLDLWTNAEPGDFVAIYGWANGDPSTGAVSRVVISIGNNP